MRSRVDAVTGTPSLQRPRRGFRAFSQPAYEVARRRCLPLGGLSVAKAASADVCVEVDTQRDNLSEADRNATRTMLEQALINNGQKVVSPGAGCTATWRVYHVKLGNTVSVTLSSPTDSRTMKVRQVEDIPDAHSQLVKSLLTGAPSAWRAARSTAPTSPTRRPPTTASRPTRSSTFVSATAAWSARVSPRAPRSAWGGAKSSIASPSISPGFNFVTTKQDNSYKDFSGSIVKLGGLYYFDPYANNSLYAGGGLSWGVSGHFEAGGRHLLAHLQRQRHARRADRRLRDAPGQQHPPPPPARRLAAVLLRDQHISINRSGMFVQDTDSLYTPVVQPLAGARLRQVQHHHGAQRQLGFATRRSPHPIDLGPAPELARAAGFFYAQSA